MTITEALHALCVELAADGVPAPLAQPFTLAALWHDLARLAGEEPPRWVAVALGDASGVPGHLAPVPIARPAAEVR